MSVLTLVPMGLRPWSGFARPQFPVAVWNAEASILGDASGGSRTVAVEFKAANAPGVPRLFNLEQIDAFDNLTATSTVDVLYAGWDHATGDFDLGLGAFGRGAAMQVSPIAGASLVLSDIHLPILLGIPTAAANQVNLQFRMANSDGDTLRVRFQGYVWDARSFQVEGGPQRPATGLWG